MMRLLWLSAFVCAADQVTKLLALAYLKEGGVSVSPFLDFALAYNTGAAFSFLSDAGGWQNFFFIGVATVVSAVIFFMLRRLGDTEKQVAVALALVLGGAVGNVIDRIRFGYVVDFIDVYYHAWHWPTFNIADSAITLGAILLVLDSLGIRYPRAGKTASS